jgi:hypothetical protein
MILDNTLNFVASAGLTMTTDSSTASYVLDLATGQMLTGTTYTVTPNLTWGLATYFGEDLGIGPGVAIPRFLITVGTAFTTGNAATLNVQVQTAAQAGTTGTISSDTTFATAIETGIIAASLLTANAAMRISLPRRKLGQALPRFIRLNFALATGQWTAGSISNATLAQCLDEIEYYGPNFVAAA